MKQKAIISGHGGHRRLDVGQRLGEVAQDNIVTGPFDGTAFGVTKNDDQPSTRGCAGKFQTAEDIVVDKVSRNACTEDIANALVEYQFIGRPRVNAAHNGDKRKLAAARRLDLLHEVAFEHVSLDKSGVALFEHLQGCLRSDRGLGLFSLGHGGLGGVCPYGRQGQA